MLISPPGSLGPGIIPATRIFRRLKRKFRDQLLLDVETYIDVNDILHYTLQ